MKLEYIPDNGSKDTPLVRLYDFVVGEAFQLRRGFANLATESIMSLELHHADYVDAVNGSQLTLTVNPWDQGLVKTAEPATLRCALTAGTWDNIEGLTEPFTQPGSRGFQWLNATGIRLLLSHDGRW